MPQNEGNSEESPEDEHIHDNAETLAYTLNRPPPLVFILGAALQHTLTSVPTCLVMAVLMSDAVGAHHDSIIRTQLFSTILFTSGICTLLQTGLGVRLPIIQGPAGIFLSVLFSASGGEWDCADSAPDTNFTDGHNTSGYNHTSSTIEVLTCLTPEQKIREISGSLMAASLFEMIVGGAGLVGHLLRFVGPVTVTPTVALLGIAMCKLPITYLRPSWELSLLGVVLVVVFALYLGHVRVSLPTKINRKGTVRMKGRRRNRGVRVFQLFPVIPSILVVWAVSAILTHVNVFPSDRTKLMFGARTDAKVKLLHVTPWVYLPYPGQFGMPSFNLGLFVGYIASFYASMMESLGDYFAAAKTCEVASPPTHAVNRGIMVEGIGGLLSGSMGFGLATTSFSENIATITLTRTAHRYIMYATGVLLVLLSVVGKAGAAIATIPDPALAGVMIVTFGMLVSLGLSTLQYVNLNSSRNLLIIGLAISFGIAVPRWLERYPADFKTGLREVDSVLRVILGNSMLLGGGIAMFLDNTTKGSRKDRGIDAWQNLISNEPDSLASTKRSVEKRLSSKSIYGWFWLGRLYQCLPWCSKLPFMPASAVVAACDDHQSQIDVADDNNDTV